MSSRTPAPAPRPARAARIAAGPRLRLSPCAFRLDLVALVIGAARRRVGRRPGGLVGEVVVIGRRPRRMGHGKGRLVGRLDGVV